MPLESGNIVKTKMGKFEGSDPHRGATLILHFP